MADTSWRGINVKVFYVDSRHHSRFDIYGLIQFPCTFRTDALNEFQRAAFLPAFAAKTLEVKITVEQIFA
jgi:hypothetical protein